MVKRRRVVPRDQLMGLLEQIEETTPSTMLMFSQARPSSELKLNLLCVLQVPLFCNLPSQILLEIPNRIKEIISRVSNKSINRKQMLAERSKTKMLAWSTTSEELQKTTAKKMDKKMSSLGQWAKTMFLISWVEANWQKMIITREEFLNMSKKTSTKPSYLQTRNNPQHWDLTIKTQKLKFQKLKTKTLSRAWECPFPRRSQWSALKDNL